MLIFLQLEGVELAKLNVKSFVVAAVMVKLLSEISKKILFTAFTITLAVDVLKFGNIIRCDPSFGVFEAKVVG